MVFPDPGSVVLVGVGQMGMALVSGWLEAGLPSKSLILVDPDPHPNVRDMASKFGIRLIYAPPEGPADILVLAVKPQVAIRALEQARACVEQNTLVISVMAGVSVSKISAVLGVERVVRTIPNTPAKIGKGAIGVFTPDAVSESDRDLVMQLLNASGEIFQVRTESDTDAVTGVSGSGPAYVFLLVEALARAAETQGLDADLSMALARQTVIGAAAMLDAEPDCSAARLRENVTSPNGTTYAGLQVLTGGQGLEQLMIQAVEAATTRSRQLGA